MSKEDHEIVGPQPTEGHHSLMEIFDELTFTEKWKKVFRGLRQPKDSGDYKYAKLQLLRLSAPLSAIAVPAIIIMLLVSMGVTEMKKREYEVQVMEPEAMEQLDEETEKLIEEIEPPEPIETEVPDEANINNEVITENTVVGPATDFSPQPATLDSVAITKSPVVLKGILGSRNPGARGSALAGYGGSAATERSVLLSLRWLKKNQEADGSWRTSSGGGANQYDGARPAMTGLALLTFLAHGETPASEEFGATVERAIKWLVENQTPEGDFKGSDENNYCQPIATYALCETFALTRIPMVKAAAEKSVTRIIKGQNPSGLLWNYKFDPKYEIKTGPDRNDLSFAGWCMQALKAASTAGLDVPGLNEAKKKSIQGTKMSALADAEGAIGFEYSRQGNQADGRDNITTAAVLCLQLLGAGKSKEAQQGLLWLKRVDCDWAKPWSDNPIYHWYYVTQAKFHAGGGMWNEWNKQFSPQLVRNQIVVKDAIQDAHGKLVDIGYWNPANPPHVVGKDKDGKDRTEREHCQSYVYNTTLCALMLQVYYRYLPTYKTPEAVEEATSTLSDENKDIDVQIL
ncbi:MAG: terpene cyclase/mutase family protein [Phycisphaeraceae bacterium]|nr:terpene cyclase/mutase family protein [Phycisphaeraceae bacterium]